MSIAFHAVSLAVLLAGSTTTIEPSPTESAVEANGWEAPPPEPAPGPAPVPAPVPVVSAAGGTAPMPVIDEAEEARLWQLRQHNRFKGMLISGFVILGSAYGASLLVGAIAFDTAEGDDAERQRKYGRRMMIPLAGPFAAVPESRSATLGILTVGAGVGQLLGLSLGIAGAVKLQEFPNPNKRRFTFQVLPTREGAHMGMSLRF